jgi:hypothetical protein
MGNKLELLKDCLLVGFESNQSYQTVKECPLKDAKENNSLLHDQTYFEAFAEQAD